jgi:hypothetical protein
MNLYIQFPEVTVQVKACATDLVSDLKKKMTFFAEEQDLLTFNGCVLTDDDAMLVALGVRDGSTVSVISRHGCMITRPRSAIASAVYAIGSGCKSVLRGFGLTLPSVVLSAGLIASATVLGSGFVIAARIYADQRQAVPSKDEIREVVREVTENAMAMVTVDNFSSAKEVFQQLMRQVRTAGHAMFRFVAVRD